MPDRKQYATRTDLTRELDYDMLDFGIESESDWNGLLDDALQTATERVDGYTDPEYSWDGTDDVPLTVREATIRLARARIMRIQEDGLNSEDLVSGAGYDYRVPEDLRDDIKQSLADGPYRSTTDGYFRVM